jgi:hypothetical protein
MSVTLVARLAPYEEPGEKRGSARRVLRLRISSSSASGDQDVLIHNLSHRGLLLETEEDLRPGDALIVELPEAGSTLAEVIWSRARFAGCRFETPLSTAALSAALLRSEPKVQESPAGEPLPAYKPQIDYSNAEESPLLRAVAIIGLIVALGVASLFIAALLSFPFSTQ